MNSEGAFSERQAVSVKTDGAAHLRKRCFDSADLFGGEREVLLRHRGQEYRLLITKAEKLILNK